MNVVSEVNLLSEAAVIVRYGDCRLVPSPLVDFTVEPVFDDQGARQSNRTTITLTGSIVVLPSGSYEVMYGKQEELRNAFATDELDFTITAGPGSKTLTQGTIICSGLRPRVNRINIPPDTQFNRFDYTIELEDLTVVSGILGAVSSFSNQWQFREDSDSCTLQVTHNVSAEGIEGETDAFEQAVARVKPELGINQLPIQLPCFAEPNFSGLFNMTHPSNPAGGPVFEVSVQREEIADVANGSYSVTEVFTIVSGVPFFFSARNESFVEDENGIATVTLQGTIQGLGRTISTSFGEIGGRGFERACSGWLNVVEPQLPADASGVYIKYKTNLAGSGLAVNNPQSRSFTQNKCRGTIQFTVSYTDDPDAFLPSGIASRSCNVTRTEPVRVFASHPIPLRRLGPVVQDIKTTSEGTVSIQCQAQAKNTGNSISDTNRAINFVQDELNRLRKVHAQSSNFQTLRIQSLNQSQSDIDLTATATVVYAFTLDLTAVPSVGSDLVLQTL